jgi:hypothetical protein
MTTEQEQKIDMIVNCVKEILNCMATVEKPVLIESITVEEYNALNTNYAKIDELIDSVKELNKTLLKKDNAVHIKSDNNKSYFCIDKELPIRIW